MPFEQVSSLAFLLALAGIATVASAFILERAQGESKMRRLALAFLTVSGSALVCLGAWLALART
jgi:hypothetical protein